MLTTGPEPKIYDGQPQDPALPRQLTVTASLSCETLQSKFSGTFKSKSTVTSPFEPDFTSIDPGAVFITITLGLPVTLRT
jgi:hypothetical protein